jgi:hypothetical protein
MTLTQPSRLQLAFKALCLWNSEALGDEPGVEALRSTESAVPHSGADSESSRQHFTRGVPSMLPDLRSKSRIT